MNNPDPNKANRLAIGFARNRNLPYHEAEALLKALTLRIVVMPDAVQSSSEQAALLTALNTGRRAFLGGVQLVLPDNMPTLQLPLPGATDWPSAFRVIGFASIQTSVPNATIYLGTPPPEATRPALRIFCDSWRGGVADVGAPVSFRTGDADFFALGGIYAGAAAVHRAFVQATHLPTGLPSAHGISLWNEADDWTTPVAVNHLRALPKRFWLLGLGHLGQAFLWTLAFLPYADRSQIEYMLQDFDKIDESNDGSGLFCSRADAGKKKARHSAAWLEAIGFKTTITERPFGELDRCGESEPTVALCGFDKARPRTFLSSAGFKLIVECGLGGSLADFDQGEIHVFPSPRHSPQGLWGDVKDRPRDVDPAVAKLFGGGDAVCGALAVDVAGKAVSTSFVGAVASTLVVAELLRIFNRGQRHDFLAFDARNPEAWSFSAHPNSVRASELGTLGFVEIPSKSSPEH